MNLDEIVCSCLGVSAGAIKEAVSAGAHTLEEVQETTGAGTVCGACLEEVKQLVKQFAEENS